MLMINGTCTVTVRIGPNCVLELSSALSIQVAVNVKNDWPPYHLPTLSSHSSHHATATRSPQWDRSLPHRGGARRLTTTLFFHPGAKHALPHHSPTLRHFPRKTRPGNARRARPETAHADGVPPPHARGGRHDTCRQRTRRGAERAVQRGANGWAAESRAQGTAWVYCCSVEGWGWHDIVESYCICAPF